MKNTATSFKRRCGTPNTPEALGPGHAASDQPMQPSAYWGDEKHLGHQGQQPQRHVRPARAASGSRRAVRGAGQSGFLQERLGPSVGQALPAGARHRQVAMLDPKTRKYTFVDTCFQTHHLQFGYDANDTLWTSGGGPVVGWVNTKMFDETGDVGEVAGLDARSARHQRQRQARRLRRAEPAGRSDQGQAHRRRLLRRDAEPGRRLGLGHLPRRPGAVVRLAPGANPPGPRWRKSTTCRCRASASAAATSTSKASSGCRWRAATSAASTGANAKARSTGRRRPAIIAPRAGRSTSIPGPGFNGIGENSAESSYYTWVDQHNTFGLGEDVPMSTGNLMTA